MCVSEGERHGGRGGRGLAGRESGRGETAERKANGTLQRGLDFCHLALPSVQR